MKCFTFVNVQVGTKFSEVVIQIEQSGIVSKVTRVSGPYDLIVELEGTQEEIRDIITWKIRKLQYVKTTLTIMVNE